MSDYIFKFMNPEYKIKGILSAIADNDEIFKIKGEYFPSTKRFTAEIIGFIWTDENQEWNWRFRMKFASGDKQVCSGNLGKDANETKCLHEMYKFPMKEKHWFPNPEGTVKSLIELMKKEDLIESIQTKAV